MIIAVALEFPCPLRALHCTCLRQRHNSYHKNDDMDLRASVPKGALNMTLTARQNRTPPTRTCSHHVSFMKPSKFCFRRRKLIQRVGQRQLTPKALLTTSSPPSNSGTPISATSPYTRVGVRTYEERRVTGCLRWTSPHPLITPPRRTLLSSALFFIGALVLLILPSGIAAPPHQHINYNTIGTTDR